MDFKKVKASNNTMTRNTADLAAKTGNLYESVVVMSQRANQISVQMKDELKRKLDEFASSQEEKLEEVFENHEQIEVSKFYERIPKPTLIAEDEFEKDEIYYRDSKTEN